VEISTRIGNLQGKAKCLGGMGEIRLVKGGRAGAKSYFEQARAIGIQIGDQHVVALASDGLDRANR
jgi:hypothetical protein